jgi:hypothetical protein
MTVRVGTSSTRWKTVPMPKSMLRRGEAMIFGNSADEDLTFVGRLHSGEQTHQRGFAGAVFTQQDVDLAAMKLEGHLIESHDSGEALGDAAQCRHGNLRGARRIR